MGYKWIYRNATEENGMKISRIALSTEVWENNHAFEH